MTSTEILALARELTRRGRRRAARMLLIRELSYVEARIRVIENVLAGNLAASLTVELVLALLSKPLCIVVIAVIVLSSTLTITALLLRKLEKTRLEILKMLVELINKSEDCDHSSRGERMRETIILYIVIAVAWTVAALLIALMG